MYVFIYFIFIHLFFGGCGGGVELVLPVPLSQKTRREVRESVTVAYISKHKHTENETPV